MTPSKIFLYFCLSFMGGIFISSVFRISQPLTLGFVVFGLVLISAFWKYKKIAVFGLCSIFLVLGIWRNDQSGIQSAESKILKYLGSEQTATITAIVAQEPVITEKSQRILVRTEKVSIISEEFLIKEKILITVQKYPEYKYGDKLRIAGKLKAPSQDLNGFNYRDYLKKDGIFTVMDFPKTELIGQGLGNPLMAIIISFKDKFKETARNLISPPQEGLLEALVFGDEDNISKEWKEKFNLTGTRHIAAVSGMNITIIASIILSLALGLGLWRQQAFYLTVFLLVAYILMIGAPSSALRAGVMAGIFLLAQYSGRSSQASKAVIFASTFMLALNPMILRLDVGFQLSFLAILGIIYFQPIFMNLLAGFPNPRFMPFRTALSTTLSAQIFTLPILIYNFGYISLVSPIANLLIVPILASLTILIFILGFLGMVFLPLGVALSWPVWFFLTYIIKVVDIFSKIPFASLNLKGAHWSWLAVFYLIAIFLAWKLRKKRGIQAMI